MERADRISRIIYTGTRLTVLRTDAGFEPTETRFEMRGTMSYPLDPIFESDFDKCAADVPMSDSLLRLR